MATSVRDYLITLLARTPEFTPTVMRALGCHATQSIEARDKVQHCGSAPSFTARYLYISRDNRYVFRR